MRVTLRTRRRTSIGSHQSRPASHTAGTNRRDDPEDSRPGTRPGTRGTSPRRKARWSRTRGIGTSPRRRGQIGRRTRNPPTPATRSDRRKDTDTGEGRPPRLGEAPWGNRLDREHAGGPRRSPGGTAVGVRWTRPPLGRKNRTSGCARIGTRLPCHRRRRNRSVGSGPTRTR